MPYSRIDHRGRRVLRLEGAVTIRHAQDLAAELAATLDDGAPAVVETAKLEDVDTCMLQLLCSLRKAVPALAFDDPSDAFLRALERCGMRRELLGGRETL